jgi:hypothetical protein
MLHEIDRVLRALLTEALPAGVSVDFTAPDAAWAARGPVINLFLCRVNENPRAREGCWTDTRDAHGRVVSRQPPPRQYRVGYVLTAWDADAETEHALLGSALGAFAACDLVPAQLLGQPVTIDVGHPDLGSAAPPWEALGIRPRAYLDVVVTVLAVPAPVAELASAPETVDLGMGSPPRPAPARPAPGARPGKRVSERS